MYNIIKRLKQSNWFVTCQNEEQYYQLMQLCHDADLVWACGSECLAKCFLNIDDFPVYIGVNKDYDLSTQSTLLYSKNKEFVLSEKMEDITNMIF